MGITTEEFFQNVYNVMFSPKDFFENENNTISIRLATAVIVFMTIINKVGYSIADKTVNGISFIFTLISGIFVSIIIWLLLALFYEYIATIFARGGNYKKLLYFTSFITLPAILFAPISLLKQAGEIGYFLSVIFSFLLYFWIMVLYAYALKATYRITLARSFMFIFLPVISFIPMIYQIVGFYHKIWYIFSI